MHTVAPRVGAWIETPKAYEGEHLGLSHPVWVRGLKLKNVGMKGVAMASHPVWVRGLKHHETICCTMYAQVAPRVGAWIETTARRKIRRIT